MKKLIIGLVAGLIMGLGATVLAYDYDEGWVSDHTHVSEWTDPDTHLQYLIVESPSGDGGCRVAICPRYTASGSIRYVGNGND